MTQTIYVHVNKWIKKSRLKKKKATLYFPFFFGVLGFELKADSVAGQSLYHLSHNTSPKILCFKMVNGESYLKLKKKMQLKHKLSSWLLPLTPLNFTMTRVLLDVSHSSSYIL
jgi:hypothetical protein